MRTVTSDEATTTTTNDHCAQLLRYLINIVTYQHLFRSFARELWIKSGSRFYTGASNDTIPRPKTRLQCRAGQVINSNPTLPVIN